MSIWNKPILQTHSKKKSEKKIVRKAHSSLKKFFKLAVSIYLKDQQFQSCIINKNKQTIKLTSCNLALDL